MNKLDVNKEELQRLLDEYSYDPDIMDEEDQRTRSAKWALTQLDEPDRIIFLLQTEYSSQRKVGALLGVSRSTIRKEFNRIRKHLMDLMYDKGNVDNHSDDSMGD